MATHLHILQLRPVALLVRGLLLLQHPVARLLQLHTVSLRGAAEGMSLSVHGTGKGSGGTLAAFLPSGPDHNVLRGAAAAPDGSSAPERGCAQLTRHAV